MSKAYTIIGKAPVLGVRIDLTAQEASDLDHFLYQHTLDLKDDERKDSVAFMLHCTLQSRHHRENLINESDD